MKIHQLDTEQVLHSLHSRLDGLIDAEAKRRLVEYGPNRVEKIKHQPLGWRLLRGFTHFFALVLWVAAALAGWAELMAPGQGMAILGLAIVAVILINGLFSFWQEYRAERSLRALEQLLPHKVKVMRDGYAQEVPTEYLVPGDVVLLQEGDDIPADCRLIEAYDVRVNNATVTGESLPLLRDAQPSTEEALLQSRNILLAGTIVVSGEAKAIVFATGMHTEFGKIAHLTQTSRDVPSPLQKEIIHLSRIVVLLATGLGVVFFYIGQRLGLPLWDNLIFAIGIIVANVPEGLLPTVTLALAMGSQRMARHNALIRHLPAVETLGSATVICTDKTGTLTQNKMSATRLYFSGQWYDLSLNQPPPEAAAPLLITALLCHNLKATENNARSAWLGDPMEIALVQMAQRYVGPDLHYPRLDEIPFDADRKCMSTLYQTPAGLMLYSKGALEALLKHCTRFQQDDEVVPLDDALRHKLLEAEAQMAEAGLRVLAMAMRPISPPYAHDNLEQDLILSGLVGLEDPVRPEVPEAISKCRSAGIKVIMITGDHPHTALAVAREIGMIQSPHPVVFTGDQLYRLSTTQLQLALDVPEILFARVAADQKLRIVSALKQKREIVAVTGDGVNDAPALKRADIGIAMGITGTDVAREAADMVLLDDNFASIVAAIEEGRSVYANIRKFLTYILTSNVPEIIPYLTYVLFKIPLPLTIIQILAIDLGTDMVPALGLGAERPDPRVMQQPPRPRQQRLLDMPLLMRAYLFLGLMEAMAAMATFFFVLKSGGWHYGDIVSATDPLYLQATTACFCAIIVMQIINVFLCRHERDSVFSRPWWSNKLIVWGVIIEILLIILLVYTPWGNLLIGTAPLAAQVWLFLIPFAIAMLLFEELRKRWLRRLS